MPLSHRNVKPKIRKVRPLPNRKRMIITAHMKARENAELMSAKDVVADEPIIEEKTVESVAVDESVEVMDTTETVEQAKEVEKTDVVDEKPKKRGRKSKIDNGQTEFSDDGTGTD